MDGHSGIENNEINRGSSGIFSFVLSFLKQSNGQGSMIIHATTMSFYGESLDFLPSCGFTQFRGACKFHNTKCFWRSLAEIPKDCERSEHMNRVQGLHQAFKAFAEKADDLYQLQKQQNQILRNLGLTFADLKVFSAPTQITVEPSDMPIWVQEDKFQRLKELEKQRDSLDREIKDLSQYLPLIYASGDLLVEAVLKSLRFLGLQAARTEPGFTADILAHTLDGGRHFGIEVTGINGPVKKDSNKVAQLLQFEMIKENKEKTVLIANTHNTKPISDRQREEHFTQPVITVLAPHPILLMTGWDLYRLIRDTLAGTKTKDGVIGLLYEKQGVFVYD